MELKYKIEESDINQTINTILTSKLKISTRLLNKLINQKNIYLNSVCCDTRNKPLKNDIITVNLDSKENNSNIVPTKMDLKIIYEDEWMLVVDKPSKIPIHPSRAHFTDSLSNGIRFYFDSIGLNKKIRPVNRLDLGTSGLVIFAKCEYIQECLIKQMVSNTFKKEYLCLVTGILENKKGTISFPISRKPGSIIERCVDIKNSNNKPCITNYEVISEFKSYSLVKCQLQTGRTHQIRVHMKEISHPLLGDTLYGTKSDLIDRQALHSYKIECIHPITNKPLVLKSELPEDMGILIK